MWSPAQTTQHKITQLIINNYNFIISHPFPYKKENLARIKAQIQNKQHTTNTFKWVQQYTNKNKNKAPQFPARIYYIKITNTINNKIYYKIGFTTQAAQQRIKTLNFATQYKVKILLIIDFANPTLAYCTEQYLHFINLGARTKDRIISSGNTEIYETNVLGATNNNVLQFKITKEELIKAMGRQ